MTNTEQSSNQKYKYCYKCGNKLFDEAEICPKCGVRQPITTPTTSTPTTSSKYDKLTAALLAIFLGSFGVHKFYLGKTIQGFFYLILFWTFIPGIIGFFEGLVYLATSQEDFDHKYNSGVRPQKDKKPSSGFKVSLLIVFAVFGLAVLWLITSDATKPLPRPEPQNQIGNYSYNSNNGVFQGKITDYKPCNLDTTMNCYVVYLGPQYSSTEEYPESMVTIKTTRPENPPDWYIYDDWNEWD